MTTYKILQPSKGYYLLARTASSGHIQYRDLKSGGFWWSKDSQHFNDCITRNKGKVIMQYNIYTGQDYTVKEPEIETLADAMKPFPKRISDATKLGFKNFFKFPTIRFK